MLCPRMAAEGVGHRRRSKLSGVVRLCERLLFEACRNDSRRPRATSAQRAGWAKMECSREEQLSSFNKYEVKAQQISRSFVEAVTLPRVQFLHTSRVKDLLIRGGECA
jgi:hypothetical protein